MVRVAIVTNSISGGGAERSMNLLANELVDRKFKVALFAINDSVEDFVNLNCPIYTTGRQWKSGLFDTLRSFGNFSKLIRNFMPDITIVNCDLPELFTSLTPNIGKLICVEHVNKPWITRKYLGFIVRRILKIRKVLWVAVSDFLEIWPFGLKPNFVIENPLIEKRTIKLNADLRQIRELIFIGRLTKQKNPLKVIEVAKILNLPCIFVGDGELKDEIEEKARSLGCQIQLHGFKKDLWRMVAPEQLLIVPSIYEGDGLVVLEAIQNQVPILISDIPEFRRFKLKSINYAKTIDEYVNKIRQAKDINEFVVPESIAKQVLSNRNINLIGKNWEKIIKANI